MANTGKAGGKRKVYFETACEAHGSKHLKEHHRSVRRADITRGVKRTRHLEGCPACAGRGV